MRLKGDLIRCSEKRPFLYPWFSVAIVKVWTESKKRGSGYTYTGTFWLCQDDTVILLLFPRLHKQQRTKSMERLISSLWGTDTAKFQVTSRLRVVKKGVSMWQCSAVSGKPLTHVDAKPKKFIYRTFPFFFLHESLQRERECIKGKTIRCFKDRHTQSTMEASIARIQTRLGRGVLRHQLTQACTSSCIMSCFSCAANTFNTQSVLVHFLPKMGLQKSRYLNFRRARPQCVVLHRRISHRLRWPANAILFPPIANGNRKLGKTSAPTVSNIAH